MRSLIRTMIFAGLVCGYGVAQTPVAPVESRPAAVAPAAASEQEVAGAPQISTGDLVEVSVYGLPDLKQDARVSADGTISLPLVGSVKVAGLTPEKAQALIEKRYIDGGYLRQPHVTLTMKEFVAQGVTVLGEVNRPGVYPATTVRRLYDMISAAGGTSKAAGKTVLITRRDKPQEPISINMGDDAPLSANVEIFPGDTIVVSKAGIIYVAGDVVRPGGFVMENNERLTVLQAVALAGGANRTAKINSAKLLRKAGNGDRQEIPIQLAKILSSKAPDLAMQRDDILFVPSSAAKSAAARGFESIVQIATGLAVYRH